MRTGVIILAAGAATRMKRPKMLLPFGNTHILSHILKEVMMIEQESIVLVTGIYHDEIKTAIGEQPVEMIHNVNWQEGMAGSIRLGVTAMKKKNIENCFIILSDQPFLDHTLLAQMQESVLRTGRGIIAAAYAGIAGTPVLFARKYFEQLQELRGDCGAKGILQQHPQDLATIVFPLGAMDIDTPADYAAFCQKTGLPNVD